MPLPPDRLEWPPKPHKDTLADIAEWSAWYSGEPEALADAAIRAARSPLERMRHWLRPTQQQHGRRNRLHVPLAGEVAAKSADLLFGEKVQLEAPADATGGQDRLNELVDELGLHNRWLEAAEICAALGGVYLRPVWDAAIAGYPLLTVVHPDQALPEFRFDRLSAVTFFEEVHREGSAVWRHVERHEPGLILHGLYVGDATSLGKREPLDRHPKTAGFDDEVRLPAQMSGVLLPDYVPNMLPNAKRRWSQQGRADISRSEGLLDALDETWSSWMRDIRLGAARLIVPDTYLDVRGRGEGASFDVDREIFTPLSIDPTNAADKSITPVEFKIRHEEHAKTSVDLTSQIVSKAGYSPETFGVHESGPADSGRALSIRQGSTWRTKGKKEGYWTSPLRSSCEKLLAIDRYVFNGPAEPFRPTVTFGDGIMDDPQETATTLELLRRADAISTLMAVKMAQPELEGNALDDEVARVLAESGRQVADPTGMGD